jgi:hypothetical protein
LPLINIMQLRIILIMQLMSLQYVSCIEQDNCYIWF